MHPACAVPAARFPDPIPVRIVPKRGPRRRVDAVLVDDAELDWLRRFLIGRPVSELAFILPGNERHLVTAPGGLPEALPFGAPLAWIGPGAIYIELGSDFDPPLPAAARQARFLPDRDAVVGVLRSGTWRFDPENMVPVWTLWVGDAPTVQTGMAIRGRAILAQADYYLSAREMPQPGQGSGHLAPISDQERTGLIEAAQRAELNGGFVRAAELLEQAGLHGPAGRLYERAAGAQGVQQH